MINIELRFTEAYSHFLSAKGIIERLNENIEYDKTLSYKEDNQALVTLSNQLMQSAREIDWIRGVLHERHNKE